jgi:hypothetical protein
MRHNRNWTLCRLGPRRGISSSQDHRTAGHVDWFPLSSEASRTSTSHVFSVSFI